MNLPPLPQPSAHTCPNCGAPVEGNPRFCPRCGATLGVAVPSGGGGCFVIGIQVFLAIVALGLGLCGACFVLVGGSSGIGNSEIGGSEATFIGIGLGALVLAGLCIWGIIKLGRSK